MNTHAMSGPATNNLVVFELVPWKTDHPTVSRLYKYNHDNYWLKSCANFANVFLRNMYT